MEPQDNISHVTKYFDHEAGQQYAILFGRDLTEAEAKQAVEQFKPWKVTETDDGVEFIIVPDSTWLSDSD